MKQLICPHCQRPFELEQAVREKEHGEVADIAAQFGQQWNLVYEYSDTFRQSEWGDVSLRKRLRIFREMMLLFEARKFALAGKVYRTGWQDVIAAMTETCNANKWGFKNHNYLKTILKKTAARESAEGMTAKEEENRHKAQGARRKAEEEEITLAEHLARHKINRVAQKIGDRIDD